MPAGCIHLRRCCVALTESQEQVAIRFEDGSTAEADLVIGADGNHSAVRTALLGPEKPRFTGHVAFRGLIPIERLGHLELRQISTIWWGPRGHVVHHHLSGGKLLNLVCVTQADNWTRESWTDYGDVEEVWSTYADWDVSLRRVLGALTQTLKWALFDRDPLPRWGVGRITLLGDACHAMLPFAGQGSAQAIEDAASLARCLAAQAEDIPAALLRYQNLRMPRTTRIQDTGRANAVRFHPSDGPEQQARDAAVASRFGLGPELDWLFGHDAEAAAN